MYGRTLAAQIAATTDTLDWDRLLRQHQQGASVRPGAARGLCVTFHARAAPSHIRLDWQFGEPSEGTQLAWRYLLELQRASSLSGQDLERVSSAFQDAPYETLKQAGVTTSELVPKLAADLHAWDFDAQNRAARFLLAHGSPHVFDDELPSADRANLAALLVSSADRGGHGAQDAATRSRIADWPVDAIASALWASWSTTEAGWTRQRAFCKTSLWRRRWAESYTTLSKRCWPPGSRVGAGARAFHRGGPRLA